MLGNLFAFYIYLLKNKKINYHWKQTGETGVGKSQILLRYTRNDFKFETNTTVGVEFAAKKITIEKENKVIKVQIWDTTG